MYIGHKGLACYAIQSSRVTHGNGNHAKTNTNERVNIYIYIYIYILAVL